MRIKNTNKPLYYAIGQMLQGLCYWMGFRMECYAAHAILEGEVVGVALGLLNAHIDHNNYVVKLEYPYKQLSPHNPTKKRADIVILEKNKMAPPKAICVLEFKLMSNTNGGIWSDINKLSTIPKTISRLAILLARKDTVTVADFVDNMGNINEKAKSIINSPRNKKSIPVKAILSKKAMKSPCTDSPFRAICIEIDD